MFKNRSKVVFTSMVLGAAYLIYVVTYFWGINQNTADSVEAIGSGVATALVMPHMILLLLAVLFNIIAFFGNKKWACITGLVLYCVSAAVFILYAMFEIPMIILSAVGISKIKKIIESQQQVEVQQ